MPAETTKTIWDYLPSITALVAVMVGPLVSLWVTRQQLRKQQKISDEQIRANLFSSNRYREMQTFKEMVAEFFSRVITVQGKWRESVNLAKNPMARDEFNRVIDESTAGIDRLMLLGSLIEFALDKRNKLHSEFSIGMGNIIGEMKETATKGAELPPSFKETMSRAMASAHMIVDEQLNAIEQYKR